MTLPEPGDTVRWLGHEYRVVGVLTQPGVIMEDANGFRQTVAVSALDQERP